MVEIVTDPRDAAAVEAELLVVAAFAPPGGTAAEVRRPVPTPSAAALLAALGGTWTYAVVRDQLPH